VFTTCKVGEEVFTVFIYTTLFTTKCGGKTYTYINLQQIYGLSPACSLPVASYERREDHPDATSVLEELCKAKDLNQCIALFTDDFSGPRRTIVGCVCVCVLEQRL